MTAVDARLTGFIFARGGSKGVPRKNVRMVGGKPLIAWAIECALASQHIERVVVSTDDEEIASVSRDFGADTPFMRPADLAGDNAPELLSWRHAYATMRALDGDAARVDPLVSIPTTSPLRSPEDIDAAIDEFERLSRAGLKPDVVLAVTPAARSPYFNMVVEEADGLVRLAASSASNPVTHRQAAPKMFDITTSVYVARPDFVLQANSVMDGIVGRVVVPQERALDIDTEFDLEVADLLLSRRGRTNQLD